MFISCFCFCNAFVPEVECFCVVATWVLLLIQGNALPVLWGVVRVFPFDVPGNLARSAMTNSQMLLQLSYMQAAYAACPGAPKVLNLSNGIRLPFAKPLVSHGTWCYRVLM